MRNVTYPLVEVTWRDANSVTSASLGEARSLGLATLVSAGHLIAEYDDRITLAMEFQDDNGEISFREVYTIPRGDVVSVKKLRRSS